MLTKEQLEKLRSKTIGLNKNIPGATPIDDGEIVYFCDGSADGERFHDLASHSKPRHARYGGAYGASCQLTLPDGSIFHAIGYHGDIVGWRQDIEEGATALNIALARIDGDKLVVSDGRAFALSDCKARNPAQEDMEKILGGSISDYEGIPPGAIPVKGVECVYFYDNGKRPWHKQFDAITTYSKPHHAQNGGANAGGYNLTLPDGSIFYAVQYHGDLAGWRQDIEEGAAALNITLAKIDDDKFVVADGRVFSLFDCVLKINRSRK